MEIAFSHEWIFGYKTLVGYFICEIFPIEYLFLFLFHEIQIFYVDFERTIGIFISVSFECL